MNGGLKQPKRKQEEKTYMLTAGRGAHITHALHIGTKLWNAESGRALREEHSNYRSCNQGDVILKDNEHSVTNYELHGPLKRSSKQKDFDKQITFLTVRVCARTNNKFLLNIDSTNVYSQV